MSPRTRWSGTSAPCRRGWASWQPLAIGVLAQLGQELPDQGFHVSLFMPATGHGRAGYGRYCTESLLANRKARTPRWIAE